MKMYSVFQTVAFLTLFFLSFSFNPVVKGEWDMESAEDHLEHQYREWELADGTKIRAQYMGVEKNAIILRDENMQPIILKTWELSKEDARFQREMWKKHHGEPQGGWDEKNAQKRIDRQYREWELADGTKIFAQYKDVGKNTILLVDLDGNPIVLKTKELSKEDAAFQRQKWDQHLRDVRKERAEKRKQR